VYFHCDFFGGRPTSPLLSGRQGGSNLVTTSSLMIAHLNYVSTQIYALTPFDAVQTGISLAVA
jgi:hypothetical protein